MYVLFSIFAESIKSSGVLAVVFMGFMVSKHRQAISPLVEDTHHFWEMVGFIANKLLFFITGQVIPAKVAMLVIDCGKAISLLDDECANVIDALLFFAPNKDYLPQTRVGAIRSLEYLYHHQPIVFSPKMQNYCKVKSSNINQHKQTKKNKQQKKTKTKNQKKK